MTQVLLVAIGVVVAVFVLVLVGQLGKVLLERNPHSVWGERLTIVGIAARRSVRILAARYPVARAIADSLPDSDPPPPSRLRPPPPLLVLCIALGGCTPQLEPAVATANEVREVGIAGAELLEQLCTEPFRRAQTREEVDAIRERGCREAANAYDAMRTAHTTLHAVIRATQAGQCVGVSRSSRDCNVAGAYVELAKAASQWATALQRIEGETP